MPRDFVSQVDYDWLVVDTNCYPYSGALRWSGGIDARGMGAGLWSDERVEGTSSFEPGVVGGRTKLERERRDALEGRWNAPRKARERTDG